MSTYTNTVTCYTCNMEIHITDAVTADDIHHFCSTYCLTAWRDGDPANDEDDIL